MLLVSLMKFCHGLFNMALCTDLGFHQMPLTQARLEDVGLSRGVSTRDLRAMPRYPTIEVYNKPMNKTRENV